MNKIYNKQFDETYYKEILDNVCKDLVKEFKQEKGNAIYNIIKKTIREYKKGR